MNLPKKYHCWICDGLKEIIIGSNVNNSEIEHIRCPSCDGTGFLVVETDLWGPRFDNFYKRMSVKFYPPTPEPPKDYDNGYNSPY